DLRQGPEKAVQIFSHFALLSGLRINPDKSYAYSFQGTWSEPVIVFEPMTIVTAPVSFRYLGIRIYRNQADLLDGNLNLAIASLRSQVNFWITLPISVAGKVTLANMVMLPRVLDHFVNYLCISDIELFTNRPHIGEGLPLSRTDETTVTHRLGRSRF
ncbi:hypothetical protein NDU88_004641, partial [Pleurodeles waltl]